MSNPEALRAALAAEGLEILGHLAPDAYCPEGSRALALIGPRADWWPILTAAPEWQDGAADPVDRWSVRVIGGIAARFGATALFPFGGPPWLPFQSWAKASGRAWESPVRLLVHEGQGLWISFRGALALPFALPEPETPADKPCNTCPQPCASACPAGALTLQAYDIAACRAFLATPAGSDCRTRGCRVRAACPVSRDHARMEVQSAYHMSSFHP